MSAKQASNDKLQGSVATYLRCNKVFNKKIKNGLLLSEWFFFKSVNTWQSYKQECGCLMHLASLANTAKRRKSARGNHVFVCNFAKYSPILIFFYSDSAKKPFLICY